VENAGGEKGTTQQKRTEGKNMTEGGVGSKKNDASSSKIKAGSNGE